ncbi:MAG: DnaJ domain-containing protein [Pseudomonadota bacterium]
MIAWAAPAAALAAIVAGLVAFLRLPPRPGLGVLLLGLAVALAIFRMFAIAGPLALVAIALIQQGASAKAVPSSGQTSEVRTDALEMSLDHDTGEMDGHVHSGPFAGARLSELSAEDLQDLVAWIEAEGDDDSLSLLLAYLDRRDGARQQGDAGSETPDGEMSDAEAYRVLGLEPGASVEEIREAHKRLIRKVHPDLGGSSVLAAMINAAKERLDPS